jgi:hypothetical protein
VEPEEKAEQEEERLKAEEAREQGEGGPAVKAEEEGGKDYKKE